MEHTSLKRKAGSPPAVENVPIITESENADNFEKEAEKIFQEDEKRDRSGSKEMNGSAAKTGREKTASTAPTVHFTCAAEWQKEEEDVQNVSVRLIKKKDEETTYFVMSDQSGIVHSMLPLEECDFEFGEHEMTVKVTSTKSSDETKVKFPAPIDLLRFAKTILHRSSTHHCIVINEGTGDYKIDENSKLQYKRNAYKLKNESELPSAGNELRSNMNADRVGESGEFHAVAGLRKECHVMFKRGEDIIEILVIKARKQKPADSYVPGNIVQYNYALHPTSVPKKTEDEPEIAPQVVVPEVQDPEVVPLPSPTENAATAKDLNTSSPAPRSFQPTTSPPSVSPPSPTHSTSPEDVRDALHRVVGIELDRIEMRLNAKFEKFQSDVNTRLDRQTALLEQLLAKQSIT